MNDLVIGAAGAEAELARGGARFQFRMEFYNLFNNVNYGNPGSTYGVPLATSFGRITSAGSMRQVQLGGKLLF